MELFRLDTQKDINTYFRTVNNLSASTWKQDIQQLYRAIHTIKGGAVTVGANAILQTAKVFEDLLSDLRYAEQAPPLADGKLPEILQELGELLVGTLHRGKGQAPDATIARIQQLHEQVNSTYLAEIDEQNSWRSNLLTMALIW
jgi:HPt (histidine-containing phosphotransfer) domain-containing protein